MRDSHREDAVSGAFRETGEQEQGMARREPKEMTVEEFDDWSSARKKLEEVGDAADEVGGPRLSLVPLPEQNEPWPTDLLPPNPPPARLGEGDRMECGGGADAATSSVAATPFDGI